MLISFVGDTIGANILLLSGIPSPSNLNWHQPLMTALAKKGHNVTVISSGSPALNLTFIHIENLYSSTQKVVPQIFDLANSSPLTLLNGIDQISMNCCDHGSKSKGFKQLLNYPKDFKFDVFLSDHMAGPCLTSLLMYRFGRPPLITTVPYNGLISSSSFIGSYSYSASIPNHAFDATDRMYFWDRMMNFIYDSYESISKDAYLYPHADRVMKSIFPHAPCARDLQKNIKLVFTNSNPMIQYKEPLMPMIIPVGGMHILPPKELPEDVHEIVTKSNNGFILFSLGSKILDVRRIRGILNVMKAFPQY